MIAWCRIIQLSQSDAQRDAYENFIHKNDDTDNAEHALLDSDEEGGDGHEDEEKITDNESLSGQHPIPHQTQFRFNPSAHVTPDQTMSESAEKNTFLTW